MPYTPEQLDELDALFLSSENANELSRAGTKLVAEVRRLQEGHGENTFIGWDMGSKDGDRTARAVCSFGAYGKVHVDQLDTFDSTELIIRAVKRDGTIFEYAVKKDDDGLFWKKLLTAGGQTMNQVWSGPHKNMSALCFSARKYANEARYELDHGGWIS